MDIWSSVPTAINPLYVPLPSTSGRFENIASYFMINLLCLETLQ